MYLFRDEDFDPRQNAERNEVLSVFAPLANSLVMKILEAGDCYLAFAENHPVARRESTFPSSILHGLIVEKLSEIEGVRVIKTNKRNSFFEIGPYKVWVKKLNEDGLPWVNETRSSIMRISQKADGEDTKPVLILGYQLSQTEKITRIILVYIDGDQHLWTPIDLGDMAASNYMVPISVSTVEEPAVSIKPDKQREKRKIVI